MNLVEILKERFQANTHRHNHATWEEVLGLLNQEVLGKIEQMERTGGEPDFIEYSGVPMYVDFVKESPLERRSFCYDEEARQKRKANKPKDSAIHAATSMGLALITEEEYYYMQKLEDFDLKTSSWIFTPSDIRSKGGALFANKRYDRTFTGYNGAESYYSSRGYRTKLRL